MARLVLIDTSDELPGLLPLHAWSALMSTELVLVGSQDHPFLGHLDAAALRHEVVPEEASARPLTRTDLLGGLSPEQKGRAEWIVDRVRAETEIAYLFGPGDSEAFTRTLGMEAARAGVEVEVVYFGVAPVGTALLELVSVEQRLRGPDGCPWDREQGHRSLAKYAVEEVYELLEAITSGDPDAICEELGDVLLQVVFHAQIAADAGDFTIDDVAKAISSKLIRRHPHVFADVIAEDADTVMANWEELKAAEKPERTGVFDGVAVAQPAVPYAEKLLSRAARTGFDWQHDADAAEQVRAELEELLAAADDEQRHAELGDLLLAVIGLGRRHGLDPELALRDASVRFRHRFEAVAELADGPLEDLTAREWLGLWERAKGITAGDG
jgi:XTP/dITP diphosphohydrolase